MPTDDPTDPPTEPVARRQRVSGAALMEAIEALPGRIAAVVGSSGGDDDGADPDTGDLPPEVTFDADPEPTPEEIEHSPTPPPVPSDDGLGLSSARRRGFPRRRR